MGTEDMDSGAEALTIDEVDDTDVDGLQFLLETVSVSEKAYLPKI